MEMNVRQGAPIKLHGRPGRIHFHGRAVGGRERIKFVVFVIDRLGIVRLKGRTGPSRWRTKEQGKEGQNRQPLAYCLLRVFLANSTGAAARYFPSMSSPNNSRTLILAAFRALRPRGVAR